MCVCVCVCVSLSRLYDGKILCDLANEVKSGAVSELVSYNSPSSTDNHFVKDNMLAFFNTKQNKLR